MSKLLIILLFSTALSACASTGTRYPPLSKTIPEAIEDQKTLDGALYDISKDHRVRAVSRLSHLINRDYTFLPAYYYRGRFFLDRGEPQRAIVDFNKAILLDSEFPFAYIERARAYFALGEIRKAIRDLRKAVYLKDTLGAAHYNRGVSDTRVGNLTRGISYFEQAVETGTRVEPELTHHIWQRVGADEIIEYFSTVIEENSLEAKAYYHRGLAYFEIHEYEKARIDLNTAKILSSQATSHHPAG